MAGRRSGNELVERIIAELQVAAPGLPVALTPLRKRLQHLLDESGYPPTEPARRRVTILFADIRGFTRFAESYAPDVVVSMLNRYLALMIEIALHYGGRIDKLMGDAIMVLFGAVDEQPDQVQRAVACAVEMQQAMSRFNQQNEALQLPPLYAGVGINSGEVVAGPIGSPQYREFTVIGSAVNLAARIEAQCLRGQVLIGDSTYQAAREHVLVGSPMRVMVKGRRDALTLFELLGTTRPRLMTVPRREIRKGPRVTVDMQCYFQALSGKRLLPTVHCGRVEDLGYYGLRLFSPVPLAAHAEIKMAISLQLLGARTSDLYARVLTAEGVADGYRCGIEFTDIEPAAQQTIRQFVDGEIVGHLVS